LGVTALLLAGVLTGCTEDPPSDDYFFGDGGWPSTTPDSGATGGGTTGGLLFPGTTGGNGSVGATGAGIGGTAAGTAGGSLSGTTAGTTAGGGTASGLTGSTGAAGGVTAGMAGGSGGTTGGIFGGLFAGLGGTAGGAAGGGEPIDPSASQPAANKLPTVSGACPDFRDGAMAMVGGIEVKFWSGAAGKKGALVFYFHGTGGTADEVNSLLGGGLGSAVINEIKSQGGIVASFHTSTGTGAALEYGIWSGDDFKVADQIVACAIQANRIDPGRIHALGFSAGGLAAGAMYYMRSNYLASVATYSGGTSPWPGNDVRQDPNNKLPAMLIHGGDGDNFILSFKDQSIQMATEIKGKGATAFVCDHGGGHIIPGDGPAAAWTFFKAHPYNVNPEPWASGTLPSPVPRHCMKF
jgi:predicted esterase